jgi:peptidyl-prolyl cis-trans isomerase D
VNLHYVEISLAQMAAHITVTDAQLQAISKSKRPRTPEVSRSRAAAREPYPDSRSRSEGRCEREGQGRGSAEARQAGEDFAKLAKEYSQDPGSAQQGGDLGWSERKVWVAPFADAAYSMKVGEIRGPVKTQFGYHILKLVGIQEASTKTFEQSKADLEAEYRRTEAERQFNNACRISSPMPRCRARPISMEVARKGGIAGRTDRRFQPHRRRRRARQVAEGDRGGLQPRCARWPGQSDRRSGKRPRHRAQGHGSQAAAAAPLDAVRSAVIKAWKNSGASSSRRQRPTDAAKRLSAGESWDAVAKSLGAPLQAPRFVGRAIKAVPIAIRRSPSSCRSPPASRNSKRCLDNGRFGGFRSVRRARGSEYQPAATGTRTREFAQQAAAESESYSLAARAAAKVLVNPQAIE